MSFLAKVASLKVLWKKWDIRTFIVTSFTFQLVLIVSAPFRKRSSNPINRVTLWISYLLADWVAAQAIGLITRATEIGSQSSADVSDAQGYLFAFWAQFLLIHLGGPDTITALAIEDNELWLRTGLHLGAQAYATLGVLIRSTRQSGLWAATVLMFFAGIIKYLERVMSLSHGRLMDVDESPDHYIEQLMAGQRKKDAQLTNLAEVEDQSKKDGQLTNVEMVRDAFNFFNCHKRLFVDRELSRAVRRCSRKYFRQRTAEEAYRLVEIQLNFTYEAIYTKMEVVQKTGWKILRHFVLSLEVASLVIWCLADKQGYVDYDVRITYTLVVGAIAVDVLSFFRTQLSDWNIASLEQKCWRIGPSVGFYNKLLNWKEGSRVEANSSSAVMLWPWFRRAFLGRWSGSLHLMIDPKDLRKMVRENTAVKVILYFHLQKSGFRYLAVNHKLLSSNIWDFIFEVLRDHDKKKLSRSKNKYKLANGEEASVHELVARLILPHTTLDYMAVVMEVEDFTRESYDDQDAGRDRRIRRRKRQQHKKRNEKEEEIEEEDAGKGNDITNQRKVNPRISLLQAISSTLLNYLRYLLLYQPNMMFGAVDKDKLLTQLDAPIDVPIDGGAPRRKRKEAQYSSDDGDENNNEVKDSYDLRRIVEEINCEEEDEDEQKIVKWELIARVWVELLCYAAIRCRPNVHAEHLNQGGELLTFVWLLMVHMDIGGR